MAAGRISVCLSKTSWPPREEEHSRTNPGTSRRWLGTVAPGTAPCWGSPCSPLLVTVSRGHWGLSLALRRGLAHPNLLVMAGAATS